MQTAPSNYARGFDECSATLFVVLLLCADVMFVALYALYDLTPLTSNVLFSLGKDGGYSEMYQYIKWFWIAALFTYLAVSRRAYRYISWSFVFTYLLFDDALSFHEKAGEYVAENFSLTPPFGLRPQDMGELAASAVAGALLLSLVAGAYVRGSQAFKKRSQDMLLLMLGLVFFGVVVDMAEIALDTGPALKFVLKVVEDGGEMVVASLMLWYVFLLSVREEHTTPYLHGFGRALFAAGAESEGAQRSSGPGLAADQ